MSHCKHWLPGCAGCEGACCAIGEFDCPSIGVCMTKCEKREPGPRPAGPTPAEIERRLEAQGYDGKAHFHVGGCNCGNESGVID